MDGIAEAEGVAMEGVVEEGVTRALISGTLIVYAHAEFCPNSDLSGMGPPVEKRGGRFGRD